MGVQTPIMACAFTVLLRPQPTRRTSWKLVGNLLQAWSFSTFHLCSKLPTWMSW